MAVGHTTPQLGSAVASFCTVTYQSYNSSTFGGLIISFNDNGNVDDADDDDDNNNDEASSLSVSELLEFVMMVHGVETMGGNVTVPLGNNGVDSSTWSKIKDDNDEEEDDDDDESCCCCCNCDDDDDDANILILV